MRKIAGLIAAFWSVAALAAPSISDFTRFAQYSSVTISPKGTYLAVTQKTDKHDQLIVFTFPELKKVSTTTFGNFVDIHSLLWANDERLLLQPARRFPELGVSSFATGEIFGINVDGKRFDTLFGFAAGGQQIGRRAGLREDMFARAQFIGSGPADGDEVLIQTLGTDVEGEYNAAYRMNIYTGRLVKVITSPVRDGRFVADENRRIALVVGRNNAGDWELHHLDPSSGKWRHVATGTGENGAVGPVSAWGSDGFLVLDDRDASTRGVFFWNPSTSEHKLLFRHPESDINQVHFDSSGKPVAFRYIDHHVGYWYPDPEHPLARLHQHLRTVFRGHDVRITSHTEDLATAIVLVSSARTPGRYFAVDVKNMKLTHELNAFPHLKPQDLADVEPFEITARDGLKVRGYLTLPKGKADKNLPLIVQIHGGPHTSYHDGLFDTQAQLFASRGYAVLQVNYRGSDGRGREFRAAGYGRWGKEMQDDITDAVKWVIKEGIADPKRICAVGGGYGAYAALTGAFREPDLFQCVIGISGVYDLPLMFESGDIQSFQGGVNYLKAAVGSDMEELKRRSPVHNAEKIRAKVMLIHGTTNTRAPIEHAKRMRSALERAGHAVEWISLSGEGEGIANETNQIKTYERILTFLKKHLEAQ